MSEKLYGIEVKSVDGWSLAEDGNVLVKCVTASGGEFVLTASVEQIGNLINSLLSAFGDAQKHEGQPKQAVQALRADGFEIGATADGAIVVTLFNETGAGIPFYLPKSMAEHLSETLVTTLAESSKEATDRTRH